MDSSGGKKKDGSVEYKQFLPSVSTLITTFYAVKCNRTNIFLICFAFPLQYLRNFLNYVPTSCSYRGTCVDTVRALVCKTGFEEIGEMYALCVCVYEHAWSEDQYRYFTGEMSISPIKYHLK